MIMESDELGVVPQLHHLLALWPRLSYLNSLSPILLIGRRREESVNIGGCCDDQMKSSV